MGFRPLRLRHYHPANLGSCFNSSSQVTPLTLNPFRHRSLSINERLLVSRYNTLRYRMGLKDVPLACVQIRFDCTGIFYDLLPGFRSRRRDRAVEDGRSR